MPANDLVIALSEEIGNPDIFVGRKKELDFFLDWAFKVKKELSQSHAILARRKKGKTALVQRLYNILYTHNDPQLIPFYYRIKEGKTSKLRFAESFYLTLLSQYFGFKLQDTELVRSVLSFDELKQIAKKDKIICRDINRMEKLIAVNNSNLAWDHARDAGHRIAGIKNEKIIQIIDEFQYLNEYIYTDETYNTRVELASFYQSTAESKISPQLITGSYIGWLSAIIGKMVARYRSYYLGNLTDEDALAAAYNYANLMEIKVTDEVVAYIATVCQNDPFYISGIIRSPFEGKALTSRQSVLDILKYETSYPGGEIAKVWFEYLWTAFERVNDKNAKKIVLYLAKYSGEEHSRERIKKDLNLDMDDGELEQKLHKLVRADIIAYGSSLSDYKGLGDQVFELVFRKIYEKEIEHISVPEIENRMLQKLISSEKKASHYKGLAAEYRVIYHLMWAAFHGIPLAEFVYNPGEGLVFENFQSMKKKVFQLDHEKKLEVDIFCAGQDSDGIDYIVEVKDWEAKITLEVIRQFIAKKSLLAKVLKKKTAFIFYSEKGLPEEEQRILDQNGIMFSDGERMNHLNTIFDHSS